LNVCAGVVFLLHVYKIPQMPKKARDFFIFFELFFVDTYPPTFWKKRTTVLILGWGRGPFSIS
jgi:hypothetical protein